MISRGRNKSTNLKLIATAALTIFWLVTLYLIFQIGGRQSLLPKDGKIHQEILISHNFKKLRRNWTERRRNDGCSMANCFNFTRCLDMEKFRVFVHPDRENLNQTSVYAAILKIIRESHYFTSNPEDACLFIMSIDTTDRDRISENYLKNINNHIASLPKDLWNDGLNHLIFNLYFGTYPDYTNNDLGFDSKKAMIAWASSSRKNFRHDFDISLPLFHKQHPQRVERKDLQLHFPGHDQYLVSFKGKRYVYGIGSETRAMLHHLHNNRTMIMLTTCRHNTDWKKFEDQRCVVDNAEYDRWDYDALMANSTFCLVPRGRRLGSFRFLESLRSSCIPVVLSDGWVLPFEEIIDWSEAAIIGNEKSVLFIYNYLSEFSEFRVLKMRQAAQMIYESHFASIERIVFTTFEIIMERIRRNLGMPSQNSSSNSPALRNHRE